MTPFQAMLARPLPLDSGLRDHDWQPGEPRRAVPFRAAGVITPEAMLSNTAYELMELRRRANGGHLSPDHQRPPRTGGDEDEAARRLSDAWTRVPDLAAARRELEQLYHDTGDRRAIEAARAIGTALDARQRASHRGELTCRFCHKTIERQTITGPPPEFCSRSCESKDYRQRRRDAEAAAAKPVPPPRDLTAPR